MTAWQDISSAPRDGKTIRVQTAGGLEFIAFWLGGLLDEQGQECGWWCVEDEDEQPESWTDGICWAKNADGKKSDQPIKWKPA